MQETNERIKLANEFAKQLAKLANHFNDFRQIFEQELTELQIKSENILELLKANSAEDSEPETVSNSVSNGFTDKSLKYPIKDCKVVLNRVENASLKLKDFITTNGHNESSIPASEETHINNLCNVDSFMNRIVNKPSKVETKEDDGDNLILNESTINKSLKNKFKPDDDISLSSIGTHHGKF